jgi:hypothetical protein
MDDKRAEGEALFALFGFLLLFLLLCFSCFGR